MSTATPRARGGSGSLRPSRADADRSRRKNERDEHRSKEGASRMRQLTWQSTRSSVAHFGPRHREAHHPTENRGRGAHRADDEGPRFFLSIDFPGDAPWHRSRTLRSQPSQSRRESTKEYRTLAELGDAERRHHRRRGRQTERDRGRVCVSRLRCGRRWTQAAREHRHFQIGREWSWFILFLPFHAFH